jgi:hypothetical protein
MKNSAAERKNRTFGYVLVFPHNLSMRQTLNPEWILLVLHREKLRNNSLHWGLIPTIEISGLIDRKID